jgi:hypothetical protein
VRLANDPLQHQPSEKIFDDFPEPDPDIPSVVGPQVTRPPLQVIYLRRLEASPMTGRKGMFRKLLRTALKPLYASHRTFPVIYDDVLVDILCLCDISTVISMSQVSIGFHLALVQNR